MTVLSMTVDVERYIVSCEKCQKAKILRPVKAPLQDTPIGRTMQLFQVDVLKVPMGVKGNRYLLVGEDAFSKWIECHPMKDQTSDTITTILVKIFSRIRVPEFLHSDQGRNFEAKLLQDTCKSFGNT